MKKMLGYVLTAVMVMLLNACGTTGDGGLNPNAVNQKNTDGGIPICTSEFISDYNTVMFAAQTASVRKNVKDLENVSSLAKQFKQKYPSFVCKANLRDPQKLDEVPTVIHSDAKMDALINLINDALK